MSPAHWLNSYPSRRAKNDAGFTSPGAWPVREGRERWRCEIRSGGRGRKEGKEGRRKERSGRRREGEMIIRWKAERKKGRVRLSSQEEDEREKDHKNKPREKGQRG